MYSCVLDDEELAHMWIETTSDPESSSGFNKLKIVLLIQNTDW